MHSNSRLCCLRRPSLPSACPGTGPSAQDPRLSLNLHCGPITPPRALSLLPTPALLPPPPLPTGSHSPTPRTLWVTSSVRQAPCTLAAHLWPQPEPWGEAGLCLIRPPGLHSRNCSAGSGSLVSPSPGEETEAQRALPEVTDSGRAEPAFNFTARGTRPAVPESRL